MKKTAKKISSFLFSFLFCVTLFLNAGVNVEAADDPNAIVLSESNIAIAAGESKAIAVAASKPVGVIVADANVAAASVVDGGIVVTGVTLGSTIAVVYLQENPAIGVPLVIAVTAGNQEYEIMAAQGCLYLISRDAASMNAKTIQIGNSLKTANYKQVCHYYGSVQRALTDSAVIIPYSRVNNYGQLKNYGILLMKNNVRTISHDQILNSDGTYTTIIPLNDYEIGACGATAELLNLQNIVQDMVVLNGTLQMYSGHTGVMFGQ